MHQARQKAEKPASNKKKQDHGSSSPPDGRDQVEELLEDLPEAAAAPKSLAEARKRAAEIEALTHRLLHPPAGRTSQEVIEEFREGISGSR